MTRTSLRIPFTIGNLGAPAIIDVGKGREPSRHALLDDLHRLADCGVTAIEDYVGWNVIEPREGEIDFSIHLGHREAVARAGLAYVMYPWVHALPPWLRTPQRITPFRCLEHRLDCGWPSIFAPTTFGLFERFYELVHAHLGEPERLTIALPCDYGEFGYPAGFGTWVLPPPPALDHMHVGYWCGDDHALRAFREALLDRHGSLPGINRAYGTDWFLPHHVRPPLDPADKALSAPRRHEFLRWYQDALLTFVDRTAGLAQARFPAATLGVKCGYAGELAAHGIDYSGLGEIAQKRGMEIWSTHATLPVVFHKRIQTVCRVLDVPYVTESPTERSREVVRDRLFEDASDGARAFFEFHETLLEHAAEFREYLPLLSGDDPQVDVAVLFASTALEESPQQAFPPRLLAIGEALRDTLDYEMLDERLLLHPAALSRYRVLAVTDPGPARTSTLARLVDFARAGGIVVIPLDRPLTGSGGETAPELLPTDAIRALAHDHGLRIRAEPAAAFHLSLDGADETWRIGRYHGHEAAQPYFDGSGEERCRFTAGDFGFRLPHGQASIELRMTLHAMPEIQPARWRVIVNGVESPLRLSDGAQTLHLAIAGGDHPQHVSTLRLRGPTHRPPYCPRGEDTRDLGLLLRSVGYGAQDLRSDPAALAVVTEIDGASTAQRVRPLGQGAIVFAPQDDPAALIALIDFARHCRERRVSPADSSPIFVSRRDGVRTTRLPGRFLLYNRSARARSRCVTGATPVTLARGEIRELPDPDGADR